jgi:hypothetical protein
MALGIVALRLWVGSLAGLGGATRAIVMSHGMFLTWRVRSASNKLFMLPQTTIWEGRTNISECVFDAPLNVLSPKYGTHATVLLASESPHYVMLVKCHCATGRRCTVRRDGMVNKKLRNFAPTT